MTSTTTLSKLSSLIEPQSIVTFTTVSVDGNLHSRPMVVQNVDVNGTFRFFMSRKSPPVIELTHNPHVALALNPGPDSPHIAVSGRATEDLDRSCICKWWQDEYLKWFPLGVNDPELVLIQVIPLAGECWNHNNKDHFYLASEHG